jgi:twinkle protein
MSLPEVEAGLAWLSERFYVVRYEDEELPSIDWVLDVARSAVMR